MLKTDSLKVFNLTLNTCLSTHFSLKGFFSFDLPPKTDFKLVTFFMFHHLFSPRLAEYKFFLRWRKKKMENPYPIELTHLKSETNSLHNILMRLSLHSMHHHSPCFFSLFFCISSLILNVNQWLVQNTTALSCSYFS